MTRANDRQQRRNRWTAGITAGVAVAMLGAAYAAVPLYSLFCQVTGLGGTPQIAQGPSTAVGERTIKVRFNADTAADLPWRFGPVRREIEVKVGETALVFYRAENPTDRPISGQAGYNVTPLKAGAYFSKVDCFCFSEQRLQPGQTVEMPVSFFIDPAIVDDPNLNDVTTITLSYVFYRLDEAAPPVKLSRRPAAPADVN